VILILAVLVFMFFLKGASFDLQDFRYSSILLSFLFFSVVDWDIGEPGSVA
jgi:hypothetical protein